MRRQVALATLLAASACGGLPHPRHAYQNATAMLEAHASMRARISNFRAEARADQRGRNGRVRGTVMMFVARPDRVRFDAMTQFGPVLTLTSDGSEFALLDQRESKFIHGPTCPENIARLLGVPLRSEEIGTVLLGGAPIAIRPTEREVRTRSGGYLAVLRDAARSREEIDIDVRPFDLERPIEEQRLRIARAELFDATGATIWRITYGDHRVIPPSENDAMGVAMPFRVRIEFPTRGEDTVLRFERIDPNVEIPPEAFSQSAPPGASVEHAACL